VVEGAHAGHRGRLAVAVEGECDLAPHRGSDRVSQISPGRTARSKQLDLEADP
jgi:hypothetical protein